MYHVAIQTVNVNDNLRSCRKNKEGFVIPS